MLRLRYREAVDAVQSALNSRFKQQDLKHFCAIEKLLLNAVNSIDTVPDIPEFISSIIDITTLRPELQELRIYLKLYIQ